MAETQVDAEALALAHMTPAAALAVMPAALSVMPADVPAVLPTDVLAVTPILLTAATARPGNRLIAEAETEQRNCKRGRQERIS